MYESKVAFWLGLLIVTAAFFLATMLTPAAKHLQTGTAQAGYSKAVCAKPGYKGINYWHWKVWSAKKGRWLHSTWGCRRGQSGTYNGGAVVGVRG